MGQLAGQGNLFAIEANDDVFIFNATGFRRAVWHDTCDEGPARSIQMKPSARSLVNSIISTPSQPLATATLLELRNNIHGNVDGNGKTHTHEATGIG